MESNTTGFCTATEQPHGKCRGSRAGPSHGSSDLNAASCGWIYQLESALASGYLRFTLNKSTEVSILLFTRSGSSVNMFFTVYSFFLLGDYPIRPLPYAKKRTIALSIRLHPHTWKYSNTCFCCSEEPSTRHSDGSQSEGWAASLTHSPTLRKRKSRLLLQWERGAMELWHSQDEDCRGSVWGPQGLVDRLHGGRGV